MSVGGAREICVLVREDRVAVDGAGRLLGLDDAPRWLSLARRSALCGDGSAVLLAPPLSLSPEPRLVVNVFTGRAAGGDHMTWRTLEEVEEPDAVRDAVRDVLAVRDGGLPAPARRPDWFRAGWYDEVEVWVDRRLEQLGRHRTGPAEPVKVWSLSAVLRIPAHPEPVWFKAACDTFGAEPRLTRALQRFAPDHVPSVLAVHDERPWMLMEPMRGASGDYEYDAPVGLSAAAAIVVADLQLRSVDRLAEIRSAGVADRGLDATVRGFDELLDSSVELPLLTRQELAAARGCRDRVHVLAARLQEHGVPDALVHGDLHLGNIAYDEGEVVVYDWTDACVGHPFFDAALLAGSSPEDERDAIRAAYADAWQTALPGTDVPAAMELARLLNSVFLAVSYEAIYRGQEEASRWEMQGVVSGILRELPQRLDAG